MHPELAPTKVLDTYWHFAAERHAMYLRRLACPVGPWTDDPILAAYRFTNSFRAADRVSQYLIREVQYGKGRSQAPAEVVFRTLLFKIFNKIETWELIEGQLGPVSWQSFDLATVDTLLTRAMNVGTRIYSAAYIMPAPLLGHARKHTNHLALLDQMMRDGLPSKVAGCNSLGQIYGVLAPTPSFGPFLAFQYAIDLGYSSAAPVWDCQDFRVRPGG